MQRIKSCRRRLHHSEKLTCRLTRLMGAAPNADCPAPICTTKGHPLVQVGGGVKKGSVLHSIRTAVSTSRES